VAILEKPGLIKETVTDVAISTRGYARMRRAQTDSLTKQKLLDAAQEVRFLSPSGDFVRHACEKQAEKGGPLQGNSREMNLQMTNFMFIDRGYPHEQVARPCHL
jgi:hypothetical protein